MIGAAAVMFRSAHSAEFYFHVFSGISIASSVWLSYLLSVWLSYLLFILFILLMWLLVLDLSTVVLFGIAASFGFVCDMSNSKG